ncbi:hypothetical protein DFR58_14314 [Anaerobacterium chartisolvens]|uniref:Uncharacterized protein n=1 Tax=Anaerobacterium chartisolvens TaxID=1297424 RepID=A0A369AG25_9FIRM|nr:hypothetical protein [Anaerobacterium chartisolvens]RCX08302.1 hypothetical protein DFR58_14314 [Anaerobacterium chartisolvens]
MKANFRKIICLLVCLCFVVSFCFNSVAFAEEKGQFDKNIKVVQDDSNITKVMTEYEGDKIYATLDKKTSEITVKVVEKKKNKKGALAESVAEKETTYGVKVQDYDGDNFSAIVTDKEAKKEYKIGKSDKAKAQFVIAIPIAIGLLDALIMALLATAATVVIAGATYYVASKVVEAIRRQNQYDYYMATITKGDVYIGPAIDYWTAYDRVAIGGDIFSRDGSLAMGMASAVGAGFRGPECHGDSGYYYHYHPKYGSLSQYAHCFY